MRAMNPSKSEVLTRLAADKPRFHHMDEQGRDRVLRAGLRAPAVGDCSWGVPPEVLQWIADHVTGEMTTLETGAGYTTVMMAARAKHHYCCTMFDLEREKLRDYLRKLGIADDKVTYVIGPSDQTLPRLDIGKTLDFAYIDGCHGYPFPALDWHYVDQRLKVGGIVGMDNVELRPVREHCDFLEENKSYRLVEALDVGYFIRFYEKLTDQHREWIDQPYSIAKKDPCDTRLVTVLRRQATRFIKPLLY